MFLSIMKVTSFANLINSLWLVFCLKNLFCCCFLLQYYGKSLAARKQENITGGISNFRAMQTQSQDNDTATFYNDKTFRAWPDFDEGLSNLNRTKHSSTITQHNRALAHEDSSSQEDEDEGEQDADNIEKDRLKSVTLSASNKDLDVVPSQIENSFVNRRTFSCPRAHPTLHTGDSTADLSPEDIDIIGALGDSLATGKGLWPGTDIEFRGASFPIGGDATIDGLVTVPNILLEFNERVFGVSHGMGERSELPDDQFNCAESGAKTGNIPEQAREFLRRVNYHFGQKKLHNLWIMLIVTVGTEELCNTCSTPNYEALRGAMEILRRNIPRIFIVLLGPVQVSYTKSLPTNLLRNRCRCLHALPKTDFHQLLKSWTDTFLRLQEEFNSTRQHLSEQRSSKLNNRKLSPSTFGLLAIPALHIASRNPDSLFIQHKPLLNRKGHMYAAKWLWNRLMTGPEYNLSKAVLSEDAYFCPSAGCPYFRTVTNRHSCQVITEEEWQRSTRTNSSANGVSKKQSKRREAIKQHLILVITVIVVSAFISVTFFGTIFYRNSLKATKPRFEATPGV